MTQEELDALMNGEMGDMEELSEEESAEENIAEDAEETLEDAADENSQIDPEEIIGNKIKSAELPLPATDENKMVHQLDDVTKESEEKASEIFDIIENISNDLMEREETLSGVTEVIEANIALFEKLCDKFPDVETFQTQLASNKEAKENLSEVIETLQNSGDSIMNVMDIMQYQDIHRQKIERVINVMRALSKYMNTLFEGKVDDEKRVASATHIVGDAHNDVASTEDIEALLAQFGQ
ncbi:chemotaxis protein [Sulfurimonas paralvinellae]|uniref:Chemotaxis protein n=1 Tax=Sulfurimonas paralvinellae TaxID=317658 RepID=A0A7M1BC17_9BACT|nr:chemotaxis protein [Sulfurimonas paralvinellae]QOP46358.1 chemotaxis protein [Sulfurimonas paralvinellae]